MRPYIERSRAWSRPRSRRSGAPASSRAWRSREAERTAPSFPAGLPTPNLFTGGQEYHSVREWASVQDMAAAAATIVELAGVWAEARERGRGTTVARLVGINHVAVQVGEWMR